MFQKLWKIGSYRVILNGHRPYICCCVQAFHFLTAHTLLIIITINYPLKSPRKIVCLVLMCIKIKCHTRIYEIMHSKLEMDVPYDVTHYSTNLFNFNIQFGCMLSCIKLFCHRFVYSYSIWKMNFTQTLKILSTFLYIL